MWRVTDRLKARCQDGLQYTIVVMQNDAEIDYVLANGWAITRLSDGTFRIDETGVLLTLDG